MRALTLLVFATLILTPLASLAVPTGLNCMPTADILAAGQDRTQYESNGSGQLYVPQGGWLYGTQVGFILGFEGGVDKTVRTSSVYNLKWRFLGEGYVMPAIAFGVQNVAQGDKMQYYAVATKSLVPSGLLKVSAGVLRDEGDTLTMIGAEGHLGPIVVKADSLNGGVDARSGVSVGYNFWRGFCVTGTSYHYKNAPSEQTISLSYTTHLF